MSTNPHDRSSSSNGFQPQINVYPPSRFVSPTNTPTVVTQVPHDHSHPPPYSPTVDNTSYPPSPNTVMSTSPTLFDVENLTQNRRKSPSHIFQGRTFLNALYILALFLLIGVLAGTMNFVSGCYALKTCSTRYTRNGLKTYAGIEWLGLGPVGGLFAVVPAALAFYILSRLYAPFRDLVGRIPAFIVLMILLPATYISSSVLGGLIGWEMLHHTLKGNYDSSMARALIMAAVGSTIISVPVCLIFALTAGCSGSR